jgi:hypothetical protein
MNAIFQKYLLEELLEELLFISCCHLQENQKPKPQ